MHRLACWQPSLLLALHHVPPTPSFRKTNSSPFSISTTSRQATDSRRTTSSTALSRDSRGFVWVGSGSGLARYDGYGFKTYRNLLNDSSSISSSMVMVVKEDSKHHLWVGTWDAGLSLYDPGRDCFINFYPRPGDSTRPQTRSVYSMLEDADGVLWFGTSKGEGGIVRVDLPYAPRKQATRRILRAASTSKHTASERRAMAQMTCACTPMAGSSWLPTADCCSSTAGPARFHVRTSLTLSVGDSIPYSYGVSFKTSPQTSGS